MKNKMINNFLIIKLHRKNDKLGLRINKEFFIHQFKDKKNNETLVREIFNFLNAHKAELDENLVS